MSVSWDQDSSVVEAIILLGFKRTPRCLLDCQPSETGELLIDYERTHYVVTVNAPSADRCWQRSAASKAEIASFAHTLRPFGIVMPKGL